MKLILLGKVSICKLRLGNDKQMLVLYLTVNVVQPKSTMAEPTNAERNSWLEKEALSGTPSVR